MTKFDQTFTTDGVWDMDKSVQFWGQKVKGQGHSGIKYVGGGIIVDSRNGHLVCILWIFTFMGNLAMSGKFTAV